MLDALGRVDQPFAVGVLAELLEQLPDQLLHAAIVSLAVAMPRWPERRRAPADASRPAWVYRSSRVDLRPLQLPAEVDVDRLPLREHVERGRAGFAVAVAGRLGAAERQVDFGADRRRVDVEDAGVHVAHRGEGVVHVLRVDRRRQAVLHAVADLDRLVERLARDDRHDRSEDLFLRDAHVRRHVGEDRRLVEEAVRVIAVGRAVSAARRASRLPAVPISTYFITVSSCSSLTIGPISVAGSRPSPTRSARARATNCSRNARYTFVVNDHAAGRRAALAGRAEATPQASVDRQIESASSMIMMTFLPPISRCVFLNDGAACGDDRAADFGRAGERDDADLVADEQRVADLVAAAGDEVHDARRNTRPLRES